MTNCIARKENKMKNKDKYILELWRDGRVIKARLVHRPKYWSSDRIAVTGGGKGKTFSVTDSIEIMGYSAGLFREDYLIFPKDTDKVLIKPYPSIRDAKRKVEYIRKAMKALNRGVDCTIIHSK